MNMNSMMAQMLTDKQNYEEPEASENPDDSYSQQSFRLDNDESTELNKPSIKLIKKHSLGTQIYHQTPERKMSLGMFSRDGEKKH